MTESYKVKCDHCDTEMQVTSPASLSCNNCGGGKLWFEKTMVFKCIRGHVYQGKCSNDACEECIHNERTAYRTFELSKQVGDEENKFPVEKTISGKTTRSGVRKKTGGMAIKKRKPRKKKR